MTKNEEIEAITIRIKEIKRKLDRMKYLPAPKKGSTVKKRAFRRVILAMRAVMLIHYLLAIAYKPCFKKGGPQEDEIL